MREEQADTTVVDLMTPNPVTVHPKDKLARVYELMTSRSIRHVPVVDTDGNLEGLVTHRDLVRSALFAVDELPFSEQRDFLSETTVSEVMTTEPETTEPGAPLADVARLLLDNKFGCLPVVEGMQLVGILTEADFVKHVLQQAEERLAQAPSIKVQWQSPNA